MQPLGETIFSLKGNSLFPLWFHKFWVVKCVLYLQVLLEEIDEGSTNMLTGTSSFADSVCAHWVAHLIECFAKRNQTVDQHFCVLIVYIIVDLGPVGKLYPSCTSPCVENVDDLLLSDVRPSLYYRASNEVATAIRTARLQWTKKSGSEPDEIDV